MTIGRGIAVAAGLIAAFYLAWFIFTNNVVEKMMEDVETDDATVLSDPLVAAGTIAVLFYPALHARLLPLRRQSRFIARLTWVLYILIILLAMLGVIGPLAVATQPRKPDTTTIVAIGLSAVALVAGAVAIRASFGNLPQKQSAPSSEFASSRPPTSL